MPTIRSATPDDAAQILEIYEPFVRDSLITFEVQIPTIEQMTNRIKTTMQTHPWLVAESDAGQIVGYAYASKYREREAYQWSTEVSAYVRESARSIGIATDLYRALFIQLKALGFYKAYGVITIPNEPSIRFHEKFGFKKIAVFPAAGFKLGRWADVGWWEFQLKQPVIIDFMAAPKKIGQEPDYDAALSSLK